MVQKSDRCNTAAHKRQRKALLPLAYGSRCPFCGQPMLKGQKLDLDHAIPRVMGGAGGPTRMAHAHCNRRMGALIGNQRRWTAFRAARRVSRRW